MLSGEADLPKCPLTPGAPESAHLWREWLMSPTNGLALLFDSDLYGQVGHLELSLGPDASSDEYELVVYTASKEHQ